MYTAAALTFFATPLALGSIWALVPQVGYEHPLVECARLITLCMFTQPNEADPLRSSFSAGSFCVEAVAPSLP